MPSPYPWTSVTGANQSLIQMSKLELRIAKEARFKGEHNAIMIQLPKSRQRALEQAATKGASSWLSALPLKSHGFCLNKSEFVDGIALRYNWPIQNVHSHCACGKKNDGDHVQVCKLGGYVTFCHNALRDSEADFLKGICRDVRIEPSLLPTDQNQHPPGTITGDQAKLDIVATGLWGTFERTYFDVRVTHANADSNIDKPLGQLLSDNEKEKKRKYGSRVINTEKASFVPLVFSTSGSTAPLCQKHHKRVAELLAYKWKER